MRDVGRRDFITLLGGAAAWPLAARAQHLHHIGMLDHTSAELNAANLNGFRQGMLELGYVEGQHFVIEYRSADGRVERYPDLAAELVRLKVDAIVTRGTPAALAAKNATSTTNHLGGACRTAFGGVQHFQAGWKRDRPERANQRFGGKAARATERNDSGHRPHRRAVQHGQSGLR